MKFLGAPYPIVKNPLGFLRTQNGTKQITADLLVLLLTNPGERVMLLDYGTPLARFVFEPNDSFNNAELVAAISDAIALWEPRVVIQNIELNNNVDLNTLNRDDPQENLENILSVKIEFAEFEDIQKVSELVLDIPLGETT